MPRPVVELGAGRPMLWPGLKFSGAETRVVAERSKMNVGPDVSFLLANGLLHEAWQGVDRD